MINEGYLKNKFLGGEPFLNMGFRRAPKMPTITERQADDFSFLLELKDLQQVPRPLEYEETAERAERSTFDAPLEQVLNRSGLPEQSLMEWSLAEFERDMDLLSEGLENLPLQYRGTYSREDIYLDDD
jgi:hypothetical protein